MLCVPAVSDEVVHPAEPAVNATSLQITALPFDVSMKSTVPVGSAVACVGVSLTVAVNVTESPKFDGFRPEIKLVEVSKRSTGVAVLSAPPPTAGSSVNTGVPLSA